MSAPFRPPARAHIEELWCERLEQASKRHKLATANLQKALDDLRAGRTVPPDGSFAVRKAQLAETAAIQEHIRVLRTFVDLTVHRKIPTEE